MKKTYTFTSVKDFSITRQEETGALEYQVPECVWTPYFDSVADENAVHCLLNRIDELEETNKKYLEFTLGVLKT